MGERSDEIAGNANITIALKENIDNIKLDFTGLSIQNILINNSRVNYNYTKGKIFIDSKKYKANQILTINNWAKLTTLNKI